MSKQATGANADLAKPWKHFDLGPLLNLVSSLEKANPVMAELMETAVGKL
jgi:hypothetical protein